MLKRALRHLQRAAQGVLFHDLRLVLRLGLRATCGVHVAGEERVPRRGGLIIASNHTSFADPVVLQVYTPRRLTYLMTSMYYYVPFLHTLLRFWEVLVVKEEGLNKEAIRAATRVLERGGAVGIFPEGSISRDGLPHDALPGVALLALRARVPILPVGLSGVERLLPPDTWSFHRARMAIWFGDPISPEGLTREELTAEVTRGIHGAARRARQITSGTNERMARTRG